jgi:hypothetical protein
MMEVFVHSRQRQWWLSIKDATRNLQGRFLNAINSPAKIKPFEYVDPDTDETVYLYTDKRLSVLCIGPRRYYFDRVSGKFDGTLSNVMDVARRTELAD